MAVPDLTVIKYAAILAGSYLLGSVPFGILVGKAFRGVDVRQHGSGNIGAANAMRTLGPALASLVLFGDMSKGFLAAWIAGLAGPPQADGVLSSILGGLAAIVGHNCSCFLGFKGGKGIATSLGVLLVLSYKSALAVIVLFAVVVGVTRISSLGSLLGAVSLPFMMLLFKEDLKVLAFGILAAVFALYTHRENLKRLATGRELKMTHSRSEEEGEKR